jgi:hypothetical protein
MKLKNSQYKKLLDHVLDYYERGDFYCDEDWKNIYEFSEYIDKDICINIRYEHTDNGHKVVLTKDEYGNCEMGWKISCHFVTLTNIEFFDSEGENIDIEFDSYKFNFDVSELLPLTNADV